MKYLLVVLFSIYCTCSLAQVDNRRPQNVKNESAYMISVGYRYMEYNGALFEILPMTLG